MTGKAAEALALDRESVARLSRSLPPDHARVITARINLAYSLIKTPAARDALAILERGLAVTQPDNPQRDTLLDALAKTYLALRDFPRAEEAVRRELAETRERHGGKHKHVGRAYATSALIQLARGEAAAAVEDLRRARAILSPLVARAHPWLLSLDNMETQAAFLRRDYPRAEALSRVSLGLAVESKVTASMLDDFYANLGLAQLRQGAAAEASAALAKAIALVKQVAHPPEQLARLELLHAHARYLAGDREGALDAARAALMIIADHPKFGDVAADERAWLDAVSGPGGNGRPDARRRR